jgi:hypothetical protein
MAERYRRRQVGKLILFLLAVAVVIALAVQVPLLIRTSADPGSLIGPLVAAAILVGVMINFSSLTVVIDDDHVEARFGVGWIRFRFALKDIGSCQPVKNKWYLGIGIRKIRGGWLFNIAGSDAVELEMNDGRRYRIGTEDPQELCQAIEQARNA